MREAYSQESIQKKRDNDYKKVFGSSTGQKVLLDLCRRYRLLKRMDITEARPENDKSIWFSAGAHAVLNDIIERLNTNPLKIKQDMVTNNE